MHWLEAIIMREANSTAWFRVAANLAPGLSLLFILQRWPKAKRLPPSSMMLPLYSAMQNWKETGNLKIIVSNFLVRLACVKPWSIPAILCPSGYYVILVFHMHTNISVHLASTRQKCPIICPWRSVAPPSNQSVSPGAMRFLPMVDT